MMPLAEIDRLKQTVAGSWDSPVADQVAARWGYPGRLPLFAGLHAATTLARITRALDEPGWLAELRGKLTDKARAHRQLVINTATLVG